MEDNAEEFVAYDESLSADRNIVKSVFKKLVGRYTLYDESETSLIRKDLLQVHMLAIRDVQQVSKLLRGHDKYVDLQEATPSQGLL